VVNISGWLMEWCSNIEVALPVSSLAGLYFTDGIGLPLTSRLIGDGVGAVMSDQAKGGALMGRSAHLRGENMTRLVPLAFPKTGE